MKLERDQSLIELDRLKLECEARVNEGQRSEKRVSELLNEIHKRDKAIEDARER